MTKLRDEIRLIIKGSYYFSRGKHKPTLKPYRRVSGYITYAYLALPAAIKKVEERAWLAKRTNAAEEGADAGSSLEAT